MAKKQVKRTKKTKAESLHHLISSLSYRATIGRTLLFTIIAAPFFVFSLAVLNDAVTLTETLSRSLLPLAMVVGAFFLYDFIFVSLAYYYPFKKTLDRITLLTVETGFLILLLLPLIWLELSSDVRSMTTMTLLATSPVFILFTRVLIGVWANQPKARR